MTGGADLLGAAIEPRRRGRPKGSTNKRAKDLKGLLDARYGGSAAQQSAAICMVTPAELKAAGGSMAKAQVNKALDLVQHVRRAQEGRDEWLRQLVREELRGLADELPDQVVKAVAGAMRRISEGSAGFGLAEALKLIGAERAALLPYTDQRQPLAVDVTGKGLAPAVVFQMAGASGAMPTDAEFVEVYGPADGGVSPPMSHDEGEAAEVPSLFGPAPAD